MAGNQRPSPENGASLGASEMETAVDPSICPACGAPNTCGMSQGKSDCWCFSVAIPNAALELIPARAKDLACLCPRCAQAVARAQESKSG